MRPSSPCISLCISLCLSLVLGAAVAACGSSTSPTGGSGGHPAGSGGASEGGKSGQGGSTPGTGGNTDTGGSGGSGTGGRSTGSGGATGSGGKTGAGGVLGSGGATSAGGQTGQGGDTGSGGRSVARDGSTADGPLGSGGETGTGGRVGDASAAGGASAGGSTGTFVGTKTPGTAQTGDITIAPATTYQTMDGFGIADVWIGKSVHSAGLRKLFWDPVDGIGMTLLRVGIDSTGKIMGDAAFVDAPDVVKFGGKVWAAPWSPPANLKDNNNLNNGGHLNTSGYETWATTLAAFPAYFKQNAGVDLWGLSAQNEPDFVASYQSCIFNASQMNAWIKVLGPKLAALNPPVKLIAAEPDVWSHTWNDGDKYGSAITGDATASALTEIIATHDYGSNNKSYTRPTPPAGVKQHVWETEIYYDEPKGSGKIDAGLAIARGIYSGVTGGGASGWHYWWTTHFMDGGSEASPPKRVYTMGNYSKFVRPGYVRVGVSGVPSTVHMVPFVSPNDGTVAVVVLNEGSSTVPLSFFVAGAGWPTTVTPYVTSATANLAAGTPITVTAGRFSGSVEAQSVTTFVGKQ